MKLLVPVRGSIQNPTFSPNGKSFLFNRFRHGYNSEAGADIYIADIHDRERCTLLTKGDLEGAQNVIAPGFRSTWTDKGWIAFSTDFGGAQWPALIRPNGDGFKRIPGNPAGAHVGLAPSMSPTGEQFVFERCERRNKFDRGPGEIVVGYVDGGGDFLTLGPGSNPSWSPDGQSIAWEQGGRIVYHDVASNHSRAVGPADKPFWTPTWHAEPTRILVGGPDALYQITTTGSIHVAFAVEHDRNRWLGRASWSPDFNGKHRRLLCEASDRDHPDGGPGTWLEIY